MLMPSIFGESLLDDFFDDSFRRFNSGELMRTDIKETDQGYELTMNMPGVRKEDVKAELKDGYLTIGASVNKNNDQKDQEGRYIRRERYSGSCSRSFYVGEDVKQEDIKARFEDGTLKLAVPKKEAKPAVEEKKYISIEG
ncbi:MAG: Hsp20/alpha crystallin family protein [Coprococcus sp.]